MTEFLSRALKLATRAHAGCVDRCGRPVIEHVYRVASTGITDGECAVGALHDIVEGTQVSLDDLRRAGFPPVIVDAIEAITREKAEPYVDYIARVATNGVATTVKIGELRDKLAHSDIGDSMYEQHAQALAFLTDYRSAT